MSDLDALLAGIITDPHNALRWLVVADWLDDHDQPERAELLRLHRELIRTCCVPGEYPERGEWQRRVVELIDQGVKPCVPQHTLMLPGGVPLIGSFIPPGSFLMGGTENIDEKPIHKVTITKGFFMGIYLVTQAQWRAVMGTDPSEFKGDELPVECIRRDEAIAFCTKVSEMSRNLVRLPTEAEWEYACRAGTTTHYHFGDMPTADRMNYAGAHTWNGSAEGEYRGRTTAVGSFASNPQGLYDCHGNMFEWCSDWYDDSFYKNSPTMDPIGAVTDPIYFVTRGGAWPYVPKSCRSAARRRTITHGCSDSFGFRVVFTLN